MKINAKGETLGIFCGITGPVIMWLGMLITAISYVGIEGQRYSIRNHFVSELGEVGVSDLAWVFNTSLFVGGILATIFMVFLAYQIKSWIRVPLGIISVVATVNGALVGIFPMNKLQGHIFVAMNFFNLGMFISLLYSLVILLGKKHPFPKWLAIPGLINAGLFIWFLNFPSDEDAINQFQEGMQGLIRNRPDFMPMALLEWAVILGIILWVFIIGVYLYTQRKTKSLS
ncbi:MAG: DUF998 domain-containing protein [Anaerolineales bacterium]|jgi:hypothetical membrane protein